MGSGGAMGSGGGSGGRPGTGGGATGGRFAGSGGRGGMTGSGGANSTGGASSTGGAGGALPKFSFFVTSIGAMRQLSGNPMGFGGDLRFGETGEGAGLKGADKICKTVAEMAMQGAGQKEWRAFLSAVAAGPGGTVVHARSRVGQGPWFDRMGRQVASNLTQLMMERPGDADAAIKQDLPNENGIPNHTDGAPGCTGNSCPDNHDVLTGTNAQGMLYSMNMSNTCNDWTNGMPTMVGRGMGPWCGHSWPRQGSGVNWMTALAEGGCGPGVNLMEQGGPMMGVYTVGTGGGYGAIYCFALTP
jgi:hypothetical protein